MAGLLIHPHITSLNLSLSNPAPIRASLKPSHVSISPAVGFFGGLRGWKTRTIGLTVVTRAGPSTSSYIFAFVLPLSLIIITVLTSIRVADKLDRDFLEEVARNQAIREAEEEEEDDDDDDDDTDLSLQEPVLPRTRNRPKREV